VQVFTVIVFSALLGVGSQVLHIPSGSRLAYGLPFSMGLLLLAVLFYTGHGRFRVLYGLLLLAAAMAFVFVGLTRAIDGVERSWYLPVMSAALLYCCWVILVSKSARRFLEESRHGSSA
jgi:hypothetical protein